MKNIPSIVCCIVSVLLAASGGLNFGLSHNIQEIPKSVFQIIGLLFVMAGFSGMGYSFLSLYREIRQKAEEKLFITGKERRE